MVLGDCTAMLGELVDRNSKFVLLEFLVYLLPSLCWLLVSCAAVLLAVGEFGMVDLNPGFLELMVFSTGVVLVVLFSFYIVILFFLPFLVLNFYFIFRTLVIFLSFLLIVVLTRPDMSDVTMPRRVRSGDRELQLLQTFIDAGHVSLWREETYTVLSDGEHSLVHAVFVLRVPPGGFFGFPAAHDYVGWFEIIIFAEDLLGYFRYGDSV